MSGSILIFTIKKNVYIFISSCSCCGLPCYCNKPFIYSDNLFQCCESCKPTLHSSCFIRIQYSHNAEQPPFSTCHKIRNEETKYMCLFIVDQLKNDESVALLLGQYLVIWVGFSSENFLDCILFTWHVFHSCLRYETFFYFSNKK